MPDVKHTVVSRQGLGSRLMASIKGVLIGVLLFLVAFPVLWWNEGRAVKTAKGLKEGMGAVVVLAEARVDPAHDNQLVHVTGQATTDDIVSDPVLNVSENAIRLERVVEMYQWREHSTTRTEKKLGGSEERITEYSYQKVWSSTPINSGNFHIQEGHRNPAVMEIKSDQFQARNVRLRGFELPSSLISRITQGELLPVTAQTLENVPVSLRGRAQVSGDQLYVGANPAMSEVGDLRIGLKVVRAQPISVIATQMGKTFAPYTTRQGTTIMMLQHGIVGADHMFGQAMKSNAVMTWILRVIGFFLMVIGIFLVLKPIATLGDVIPLVGSFLGMGIGLFAGVVAFTLSLVTIAIAWIVYRPVLGIVLLVLAVGVLIAGGKIMRQKKAGDQAAAAPASE